MEQRAAVYISLGSNLGNRKEYLQKATQQIHRRIGVVQRVSSVYETPSWGFEGEAFLNAVLMVYTRLLPAEVMDELLSIERNLGRIRQSGPRYGSRTIDLDIIAYGQLQLQTPHVEVPHPRMQLRRFVLEPLAEVAPDWEHPVLKQSIRALLQQCEDKSEPLKIDALELPGPGLHQVDLRYLVIEGNIGAGKSTLVQQLANDFGAKALLENFDDNAFLPKFYVQPERYAFPVELSFLADRYRQWREELAQMDLFHSFVVADYHMAKSLIYAGVNLSEEEYRLFQNLYELIHREVPQPDLIVCLHRNNQGLLNNIRSRGRQYEQQISDDYLDKVGEAYKQYYTQNPKLKVLHLEVSQRDFLNQHDDYLWLLEEIEGAIQKVN